MTKAKRYLLDELPVTAWELIDYAKENGYDGHGFCTTSEAADFLRGLGCVVRYNPAAEAAKSVHGEVTK